jgi:hypothetical protein
MTERYLQIAGTLEEFLKEFPIFANYLTIRWCIGGYELGTKCNYQKIKIKENVIGGMQGNKLFAHLQNVLKIDNYKPVEKDGKLFLESYENLIEIPNNVPFEDFSRLWNIFESLKFTGKEKWFRTSDNNFYRILNGVKFYYEKYCGNYKDRIGKRKPSVRYYAKGFEIDGIFLKGRFVYENIPIYVKEIIRLKTL